MKMKVLSLSGVDEGGNFFHINLNNFLKQFLLKLKFRARIF